MFTTSQEVTAVFKAIVEFNKTFVGLKADADNPYFKSKYISFDSIVGLRKSLAAYGLAEFQSVFSKEGQEGAFISTTLIHESGQWICSGELRVLPVKNDPQALGSAITYGKRYQLAAMLGVAETVDDDGNSASDTSNTMKAQQTLQQVVPTASAQVSQRPQGASAVPGGITHEQNAAMLKVIKEKGIPVEVAKQMCVKLTGKGSTSQLTQEEADRLIAAYTAFTG